MRNLAVALPHDRRTPMLHEGGPHKPSKPRSRGEHRAFFSAGEIIPESGIYEVVHEHGHRAAHESVLVKGDSFPHCDTCREHVRFRVVRTAPYIFDDGDFET